MKWSWRRLLTGVFAGVMVESIVYYLLLTVLASGHWDAFILIPVAAGVGFFAAITCGFCVGIGAGIGYGVGFMLTLLIGESEWLIDWNFQHSLLFGEVISFFMIIGIVSAAIGAGLVALIKKIHSSVLNRRANRPPDGFGWRGGIDMK